MLDYYLPQTRLADVSFIVVEWMRKLTQGKIKSHFRFLPLLKTPFLICVSCLTFCPPHTHTHTKVTKERRLFVGEVAMEKYEEYEYCTHTCWGISGALFKWPSSTPGPIFHDLKMLESYSADSVGWKSCKCTKPKFVKTIEKRTNMCTITAQLSVIKFSCNVACSN